MGRISGSNWTPQTCAHGDETTGENCLYICPTREMFGYLFSLNERVCSALFQGFLPDGKLGYPAGIQRFTFLYEEPVKHLLWEIVRRRDWFILHAWDGGI